MFFKVVIFAYWSLVTWDCMSCRRLEQPFGIPPEVEICNASDPRINICFRSAANRMLKYLIKGLPEAGVAALDPVSVAWLHLPRGNDMLPALSFNASNSVHRGWRGAFVRKATARPREYVFDFEIAVPHYNISGEYSVDGTVMGFVPLSGHGPFTITTARDVKRCSANDPDLDACFKEAANKMIKHIQPGIRRLGILPMDPLRVPLVALPRNNHLLPSLAFNATDTEQHGWRDAQVIDVAMDIKNYTMHAEIYFPRYRLLGKYSVEGELLDFIPLEGEGDFDIKLDESRFGVTCRGHLVERRSRRHLEIDKVSIVTNFGRIHIHLTNLFGDEQLSDLTNALINQNSDLVVDKSGPAIESVSSELYRGLLQRFFDVVPWDSLFTDLPN